MLKLPKTVNISGKTYKVSKDSQSWGGCSGNGAQEMVIGTEKDRSRERIFATFIHEVCESVTMERNLRYLSTDDECIFVMTHKQFDDFATDVSAALWPMIGNR